MSLRFTCTCILLAYAGLPTDARFDSSTVECLLKAQDRQQLCILRNVAVWKGKIYVIQDGVLQVPADLSLASWPHSTTEHRVESFIHAVKPANLPFENVSTVTYHSHGILQHASLPSNHAHNMGETLPSLFYRICRYFGMCDFSDPRVRGPSGLLVLWIQKHYSSNILRSMHSMVTCMSNRQMALTTSSRMEVIVVGELLVGNPSTASVEEPYDDTRVCAMEPLCHRYNNFTAADVLAHRVRFWRQCVGLAPEPPLRLKGPAVLFVNRRHAAGRSILTLAEALYYFTTRAAEFAPTTFTLVYIDDMSLAQQAKLHNGADILVVPHGANFGNIIFNSAKSVVVHVSADEGHRMFNEGQTHRFDSVLNISTISATVPAIGGLDIITSQVSGNDSPIKEWSQDQLLTFISTGKCPPGREMEPFCRDYNILSRNMNYALPLEQLIGKVTEAINLWKQSRYEIVHSDLAADLQT